MTVELYTPWTAEWVEECSDWCVMGAVSSPDADGISHQPNVCTLSDWFSGDVARLIAAAPELLASCVEFLPILERHLASVNPGGIADGSVAVQTAKARVARMKDAIRKATGDTPA